MKASTLTTQQTRIDREQAELHRRLADNTKYRLAYLGGGDFIVHVMDIDSAMDQAVRAIEGKEASDGCD